jgi:hypothetical protein
MTATEATAEVFLTALRALPKEQRQTVLERITEDEEFREDLLDLTVFADRRNEPSRPFRDYLAEKGE